MIPCIEKQMYGSILPEPIHVGNDHTALFVTAITSIGLFLISINGTLFDVAIVPMSQELGISIQYGQWLILCFYMAQFVSSIWSGMIVDRLGKRQLYIMGLIFLLTGSLVGLLAGTFTWILIGRTLQGIGSAIIDTLTSVLIGVLTKGQNRVDACVYRTNVCAIATCIGPVIGGLIVHYFNWRYIFLLDIPIILASLLVTSWSMPLLPPITSASEVASTDIIGTTFIIATITSIVIALSAPVEYYVTIVCTCMFGCLFLVTIWWVTYHPDGVLPHHLFRNKGLVWGIFGSLGTSIVVPTYTYMLPLYLQQGFHWSTMQICVVLSWEAIVAVIAMFFTGCFTTRVQNFVRQQQLGLVLQVLGNVVIIFLPNSLHHILVAILLAFVGNSLYTCSTMVITISEIDALYTDILSSMLFTLQSSIRLINMALIGSDYPVAYSDNAFLTYARFMYGCSIIPLIWTIMYTVSRT